MRTARTMPLDRIRRLLAEGGARTLSEDHRLWELACPRWPFWRHARRFVRLQVEILEEAMQLPGPALLVIDDNPQRFDVGGLWTHAHTRSYRVPAECRVRALNAQVLSPGDWILYTSHEAIDPEHVPDAFQVRPDQMAAFAVAHSIPLFIQAAAGNDPWRLWVEEADAPQKAVA